MLIYLCHHNHIKIHLSYNALIKKSETNKTSIACAGTHKCTRRIIFIFKKRELKLKFHIANVHVARICLYAITHTQHIIYPSARSISHIIHKLPHSHMRICKASTNKILLYKKKVFTIDTAIIKCKVTWLCFFFPSTKIKIKIRIIVYK